ncbi:MAG: iron ABC transporter permease [Chloroflexi bacterium]|nr:iron ABC transporter permease [Chloroflexota bacterium]MCH7655575.1 iron ABC transporter permease [Chloroflexota bacterium]
MAAIILTIGFYLIYPVALILGLSFNTNPHFFIGERSWGLENWRVAFAEPKIPVALWNTVWLWGISVLVSIPLSVTVAWLLARSRLPGSRVLELFYWISYVTPGGLIAWIYLLDPQIGIANKLLELLPFIDRGPFNVYSIPGIIFVNVVGGASATSVMILTPIFRNMDSALEEAARMAGAGSLRTMMRVTLPIMVSPIALLFALQLLRMFQSFERELILGTPIGFFVYSTLIFHQVRLYDPPQYGQAVALASLTLVLIAFIIPLQRWILTRRRYTTVSGSFRPGLVDLGRWKWPAFAFVISDHVITVFTLLVLIAGSFMTRIGYFNIDPVFTLLHWKFVLADPLFLTGLRTTLILAMASGILSPLLFALIAYTLVRTRWRFRIVLDGIIWTSGAIPGMLTGLGLLLMFLWTPGLSFLFGSIGALIIVVVLQGNTTGVNLIKGNIVQIGYDMEDASRVSGAGWLRTFFTIWLRLMAPVLVLIGLFNFNIAANTTASIILLASRETTTLSLVILEWLLGIVDRRGPAGVVQIILGSITFFTALGARQLALRLGLRHQ